jgi:hypothetical protein
LGIEGEVGHHEATILIDFFGSTGGGC